ncbi:MAG: protein-methionine-sulfoxide reductase heme-binding subunit MsrQ [Gemmatimonadales bacterium]
MTAAQWVGRVARPAIWFGGAIPAVILALRFFSVSGQDLGANPAEKLEHFTGTVALVTVLISLTVTPLRKVTGINALIRLRRPIGLWAFAYACMHLSCYLVFDQSFDWPEILKDIAKRPYITVGFTAFLILLSLALTSTTWAIRVLGKRWQRLHRLVYLAATLGVFHYLWSVKRDVSVPVGLAMVLLALLVLRLKPRPSRAAAGDALPLGS